MGPFTQQHGAPRRGQKAFVRPGARSRRLKAFHSLAWGNAPGGLSQRSRRLKACFSRLSCRCGRPSACDAKCIGFPGALPQARLIQAVGLGAVSAFSVKVKLFYDASRLFNGVMSLLGYTLSDLGSSLSRFKRRSSQFRCLPSWFRRRSSRFRRGSCRFRNSPSQSAVD